MTDLILIVILAAVLGAAGGYLWRAKKRGVRCIGCPVEGGCSGMCGQPVCTCGK